MADNSIEQDENQDENLGIPSVGDNSEQKNKIFVIGVIVLVALAGIMLVMASGSEDEVEDGGLEAQVAEEYESQNRNLVIPTQKTQEKPKKKEKPVVLQIEPEKKPKPLLNRPEPKLQPVVSKKVDKEAERKKKKEEQLWEKRRKASPVVYNSSTANKSSSSRAEKRAEDHRKRIDDVVNSVKTSLKGVSNGGRLGGSGASPDQLSSRLQAAKPESVTAGYIDSKSYTLTEGTQIGCTLETAIHSNLPGMIKCLVSKDIYSFDGSYVLVPKGSQATGQYEGGIQHGESRIFAIWTRIITPNGVSVQLDSPGTGQLGRSGHGVFVDSHFMERFGASALLSIIGGLAASEGDNDDIRVTATADSFNKSAEIALRESIKIRPTGHKNQGEKINIFVARDIDFEPVLALR